MKSNHAVLALLCLSLSVTIQLAAQQSEVDRKLFEEIRTKAEQGDVESQLKLAMYYWEGKHGAVDKTNAFRWMQTAAAQSDLRARFLLGVMHEAGIGTATNKVEAATLYRKAAEDGYILAQTELASLYTTGDGVEQSDEEATKWYRKAAERGEPNAQTALGVRYLSGVSVPQNDLEAFKWLLKAAYQGDGHGQALVGFLFLEGKGCTQDFIEAYKWFNIAGSQSNDKHVAEGARQSRDDLAGRMTAEQISEAQRLAREFKPSKTPWSESPFSGKNFADSNPSATGSGFFITVDGFIITNEHVVRDAAQVRLVTRAGLISAKVVRVDAANDLALLKAEGRFAALPVAASRGMKLGGTVATVGFPNIGLQGFAPKLAKGEIASLSGAGDDARYFQISVPVQPGNSGGALVDERGNVVGVVSAKLSARAALAASGSLPENVNYAVKSSYLLSFLESVPEVSAKLKEPETKERKFEEVVKAAEQAAVLVLVY